MEGSVEILDPIQRYRSLRILTGVIVVTLSACAVLFGAFWMLMAVLCLHNFHFLSLWDCFALVFTFASPAASVAGYFRYFLRPSLGNGILSAFASFSVIGIYFIWTADASRGFMH